MSDEAGNSLASDADWTSMSVLANITTKQTIDTLPPNIQGLQCDFINTDYNIAAAVVCFMCFMFGVLYTFFGYRFFKAVMFLTGFTFAAVLVYTVCEEEKAFPLEGNIGIAVGAGVLVGLVTMLIQHVGLFLTGLHFGVAVGVAALIVVEQFIHPDTKWIPVGVLVGMGLICGGLSLKFQKTLTILGTSVMGGALMVVCLDYYIELAAMMKYVWDRIKGNQSEHLCWYSWVILGCWPFCFIVGALVQWRVTSMGVDHKDVLQNRQGINLQRLRTRQNRDAQQTRYRHLYQVRRVNGDVISQNYIQNVQHKLSPARQSLTGLHSQSPSQTTELESVTTTLTQITGTGTT